MNSPVNGSSVESPHESIVVVASPNEQSARSRWLAEIRQACGAFEWVTFVYLAWLWVITVARHSRVQHVESRLTLHLAIALGIVWLARTAVRSPNAIVQFMRHWYPLPLYIFLFEELGGLVHAIFPGWFDPWFIAFDYNIAGTHPSVWMAQFASPALNDYMQFAYMTYFLYLVILPGILYFNRERARFWTAMVSTAVAHYSVYVISVLLPIESPYYSLTGQNLPPLAGGYSTALIGLIERFARVHGAAFPSAHVAGSMVALLASWRYRRWLFWICLPFFVSMCISTVYGRYHYVADVLGGLAVGAFGLVAGEWLLKRKNALPEIAGAEVPAPTSVQLRMPNVPLGGILVSEGKREQASFAPAPTDQL